MSVDTLVKQIEELPLEQRAELVHRVEKGLQEAGWSEVELTPEMEVLLDEREADADAHPGEGYTLDEAIDSIRRKR